MPIAKNNTETIILKYILSNCLINNKLIAPKNPPITPPTKPNIIHGINTMIDKTISYHVSLLSNSISFPNMVIVVPENRFPLILNCSLISPFLYSYRLRLIFVRIMPSYFMVRLPVQMFSS